MTDSTAPPIGLTQDQASASAIAWITGHVPGAAQGILILLVPVLLRLCFDPATRTLAFERLAALARMLTGEQVGGLYEFHQQAIPAMTDQERADYQAMRAGKAFDAAVSAYESEKAFKSGLLGAVLAGVGLLL